MTKNKNIDLIKNMAKQKKIKITIVTRPKLKK